MLTLLPAIDVATGRVVGSADGDPCEIASGWQGEGAQWLHLVDLDAAFARGSNAELLVELINELDIKVELSAGVRDAGSLAWALSTGCARVVISASGLEDLPWCAQAIAKHGDRIAVALDVAVHERDGHRHDRLTPRETRRNIGDLWEIVQRLNGANCPRYLVTDTSRDGAMRGPNLALCRSVCEATSANVIASGGISTLDDLTALADLALSHSNLEGAVVGTALHAGRFRLSEALATVRANW
ncbi:MAG: HisA/HisF-related TIM barrel protein [Acidimicrobiia bacterium]